MAKYSNQVTYNIKTTLDASGVTKLHAELSKLNQEVVTIGKTQWGLKDSEIQRTVLQVNRLQTAITDCFNPRIGMLDLTKFNKTLANEKALLGTINQDWAKMGAQGSKAINALASSILTLNRDAITVNSTLSKIANTFSNTVRWGITASIVQGMMNSIQGAVSYMKDLDESLTNIQMVTGSSKEDMRQLAQYANAAAQALGSTTTDYTNAVKVFVQEGYSENEAKQYANLSTKLANVSEQNTQTTSDQITAYRNAFQLDYAQTVEAMDKVANVANSTASNVNELMTASQRAASVAQSVGAGQDSFLASIATIESVTRQSAEEIGNGLKTIYQRFADIQVGKSTEDGVKYGEYADALRSVGVEVTDAAGQFKGMDQIFKELQEVWGGLNETMRVAVGEKVAGKFQYNRFAALMNNPEYYEKAFSATQGASGMMDQMNDIFVEGIEGRLKTLQSAGEQIMSTLFDQDSVEPIIGAATDFLNIINEIIKAVGGGIPVFTAFSGILLRTFNAQIGEQVARISTNIQTSMQASKNAGLMDEAFGQLGMEDGAIGEIRGVLQKGFSGLSGNTQDQILKSAQELLEAENKVKDVGEKRKLLEDEINDNLLNSGEAAEKLLSKEKALFEEKEKIVQEDEAWLKNEIENGNLSESEIEEREEELEISRQERDEAQRRFEQTQAVVKLEGDLDSYRLEDLRAIDSINEKLGYKTNYAEQYLRITQETTTAEGELAAAQNSVKGMGDRVDAEQAASLITNLTGGLMNAVFLLQSFSSLWETLWNEDLSPQEKATAVLSNMVMTLPMLISLMGQIVTLRQADTIETVRNTVETVKNSVAKAGERLLLAIGTGVWGAETAAKKANAVVTGELTIAQWLLNAAMEANPIVRLITVFVGLITILAAATAGVYALVRSFQNENDKLKEQKAILSDMKNNYSDLTSSIDELSSSMDRIKSKKDALKELTEGTLEWKEAVTELNGEILTLLEKYPELASYVTTGEKGVLEIDEKGLDQFYNSQLDAAKKLSDATLIQQNKTLEQSNKAAMEEFAQKYSIGNPFGDIATVEAAIKEGKNGLERLGNVTEEAKSAYYKLLSGVEKNTSAIDVNNSLIGQSGNYTSYSNIDSSEFNETAKNSVIEKYGKQGLEGMFGAGGPLSQFTNAAILNKASGIQQSGASVEALAKVLGVSASNLKIKSSDWENTTYQIDGQEETTKPTEEIIEMLADFEAAEMASAERAEKDKVLYEAMGATAVEINGTIDHFEDASGHIINSLTDLDLSTLTRTNEYGMTVAETTENLQLKLGIDEEDAAKLHDQIQAKINSEGAFKLSYTFEEADEAIEKDELFGKSSLGQFLQGGQTLQYLNELDKTLGEDIDAFTLLSDKTLDSRLQMIQLEQATNTYNQTLEENQNNTKAFALQDIANQIAALGDESEESNEKLKNLLEEINRENPELLISLGIEYDEDNVSIEDVTEKIRDNLLDLAEEDFTISIQAITNLEDTTEDIVNSLKNVTSAAEKINDDFTVSFEDIEDVVAAFPGILGENGDAYETFADGSIQLNAEVAQAAINSAQTDRDATIDSQIDKIEAQKTAIDAAILGYQTELDAAIEKNNQEGISEEEKETFIRQSVEKIAGYNDTLAQASVKASEETGIAAKKAEIDRQTAQKESVEHGAKANNAAFTNFGNMLKDMAVGVATFLAKVVAPLANAILHAVTGEDIDVVGIVEGFSPFSSAGGSGSSIPAPEPVTTPESSVGQYSSTFGGLEGYIEYLEQDKKILENTKNQLNAYEAQLRAAKNKTIGTSDVANRPDTDDDKNKKDGKTPKTESKESKKDTAPKEKQNTEWDYLTDITNDLDRAAAAMEKMAKLEDRLYGKNRVSQIKKLQAEYKNYIKLLEQEVKLNQQHAERLRTNAYDENGNLTINGYAYRAGFGSVQFDSRGNIENGKAIEQALTDSVNRAIDNYNEHRNDDNASWYEEEVKLRQEDHDGFMKALSEYESTLGKIEDSQSAIQDYKEKIQDAADSIVDAIQDGIEDMLEAMDTQREFNKMAREWSQGGSGYSHFDSNRQYYSEGLKNLLSPNNSGKSVFDLQTANLQERIKDAQDVLDGTAGNADDEKLSEEAALENLQEATNSIMDSLKTVIDYYDSLLDNIEEASSKMDDLIDSRLEEFNDLEEFLETRLDQVILLFGEKSYEQQTLLYNQKINTNLEKMASINAAIEAKQVTVKTLEKLEATNKELSTEERQTLNNARDELTKLQKEQLDTETKLLQDINNKLKTQTANEMNGLLSQLFGGADVDWLSQQWEVAARNSEKYLDDYNRAYEIQKLQLKFQNALNDSQNASLATQQKINSLANEYLTYLRNKEKVSEYDVKHAQAQLDILQKQIALEDARANKNQMQLQRNAAGNYDFVYTADEEEINKMKEDLLAAQQETYNLSKQIYLETYESAFQAAMQTRDAVVEIATDASLSVEERSERIKFLMESLSEYLQGSSVELSEININLFNSFVDAEHTIVQENQGALAAIFEQLRAEQAALMEDLNAGVVTAATNAEEIKGTFSDIETDATERAGNISGTVGDIIGGITESFGKIPEGASKAFDETGKAQTDAFGKMEESIFGSFGKIDEKFLGTMNAMGAKSSTLKTTLLKDVSYTEAGADGSLKKINVAVADGATGIQINMGNALSAIDQRFKITKTNSLAEQNEINQGIKKVTTDITGSGGYLDQFKQGVNSTLRIAGDSYDNFADNNVGRATDRLGELKRSTNDWKNDLSNLNSSIRSNATELNTWKSRIDNAIRSCANLVQASSVISKNLAYNGSMAAYAGGKFDDLSGRVSNLGSTFSTVANDMASAYQSIQNAAESAKQSLYDMGSAAESARGSYDGLRNSADDAAWAARAAEDAARTAASAFNDLPGQAVTVWNDTVTIDIPQSNTNLWDMFWRGTGTDVASYWGPQLYDTGGYTGTWTDQGVPGDDKNGKWAVLHQKELILNAEDTENILSAVSLVREIMSKLNPLSSVRKISAQNNYSDTIQQRVEVNATFPGVTEAIEIKQALEQLADNAYQQASRY